LRRGRFAAGFVADFAVFRAGAAFFATRGAVTFLVLVPDVVDFVFDGLLIIVYIFFQPLQRISEIL
jgi:hypothetical protein